MEKLLELALKSSDVVEVVFSVSALWREEESDEKMKETGDEEDDGEDYDYQENAWADFAV